jgi:hypothetical protein
MKPEHKRLLDTIRPGSVWTYKGRSYRVQCVTPNFLTQDPETGDWAPTVHYEVANETHDTQVVGSLRLKFGRACTEFYRKMKFDHA